MGDDLCESLKGFLVSLKIMRMHEMRLRKWIVAKFNNRKNKNCANNNCYEETIDGRSLN